ncbi:MAG: hypothetical protein LBC34_02250 [Rickettsiales bacterium]|jgi:hypothetical protein|nr:hypothetical protein [Rickettsiales bacterium]
MTSESVDLHKQNEKHSSENSNIDRVLFDRFLKVEKKHSESINKLEETLSIQEQILLQGNVVQKAANSLEITTKGLSSELLSELKGTGKIRLLASSFRNQNHRWMKFHV